MTARAPQSGHAGPPPRLYVVALSHLDTQWRWTARDTAARFLPATVEENEALFAEHPRYTLSFEGAWRYRLLGWHHPELLATLRRRVEQGRWRPVGAAVEAFDALLPSPESILRQILHGQRWFERELGCASSDLFLPDCFGFPSTLPTLAAHAGLVGFSTQKLRRGERMRAAFGIPFAYGRWRAPDGSELLAALDPGEYSAPVEGDLSRDPAWAERFEELAAAGRPPLLMTYTGCGDRGGAPAADSIAALERSLDGDGPIEVRHGGSELIFLETGPVERRELPVHEGELLLRLHATGCYTAKAAAKRGNRRGERLARAAEAATASARVLGASAPLARLEEAWWRLLAHQMHDDLTGTSIPAAYRLTLEDQAIAANELAEILLDAVARVARELDRSGPGRPFVLFNPLGLEREELVELPLDPGDGARILGPEGDEVPTQVGVGEDGGAVLLARARVEPFGFLVLRRVDGGPGTATGAETPADRLDGSRLSARFDPEGNLAGLLDRAAGRDLLAGPVRLELFTDRSAKYPAWEILWEDLARGPLEARPREVTIQALERGPLRHSLEIERRLPGARLRERWSIGAGDGDRLDWDVRLHWSGRSRLLKSAFRLAPRAAEAVYDTGLAPARRGLSSEALYEVPAQHWAALTDPDGGVAILSDLKSGWDHPDPSTLRATWIHAPRASWKWRHQRSQDDGPHRFRFALTGFAGEPAGAGLPALAERFVHPLLAFAAEPGGPGPLGRRWSALGLEPGTAVAQALKVSEQGHELVLRLRNPGQRAARVAGFPEGVRLRRLDGRERPLSDDDPAARPASAPGEVEVPPAGLVTVGIEVGHAVAPEPGAFRPLPLPLDLRATASRGEADAHGFDGTGLRFPAELWPARVEGAIVPFELGRADAANALAARGQALELPAGWVELWLLAAAVGGALEVELVPGASSARLRIPDWRGPAFDLRGSRPCRLPVAWVSPFLRDRRGRDRIAEPGLLYALRIPLPGDGGLLRLPQQPQLRVVAATLAAAPARPIREVFPLLG